MEYFKVFGGAAVLATILTFITTAILKRSFKKREDRLEQRRKDEDELRERRAKEAQDAQLQLIRGVIKTELAPVVDGMSTEIAKLHKQHNKDILALRKDLKALAKSIDKRLDKLEECNEDERKGLQDILKDRLYRLYWQCTNKGYADREDREIFESMYKSYHKLGANGIMDGYRERFFSLPDHPEGI